MKHPLPLLLAGLLMVCPPANIRSLSAAELTASPKPTSTDTATGASMDVLYKTAQDSLRAKNYPAVVAEANLALKNADATPADRGRFLVLAVEASCRQGADQLPLAEKYLEEILSQPAAANSAKIKGLDLVSGALLDALAGQYLDQMDFTAANEMARRALSLPDLLPQDQATALTNIGKLFLRQGAYEPARASYQKILTLDVNEATKTNVWKNVVASYVAEGDAAQAIALSKKHGLDMIAIYNTLRLRDESTAEIVKILDNPKSTDKERWEAFSQLPPLIGRISLNFNSVLEIGQKYLDGLLQVDPNRALILGRAVNGAKLAIPYIQQMVPENAVFIAWAAPLILKAPKLPEKQFGELSALYINALAQSNQPAAAKKEAATLAGDERADKALQLWARLVEATVASKDAVDVGPLIKGADASEKATAVLHAAQTALRAENLPVARGLYGVYEGLFSQEKRASIDCSFVQNAPYDVGSWLNSPLLKEAKSTAPLDRTYGDNLKFLLETDSSTTGRNAGTSDPAKDTGDTKTDFHIACDARGIHIFFNAFDSHQQEVLDGVLRGGSFEMYLAPGKDQPYFTYLPRLPSGNITTGPGSFITMYQNAGFRNPSIEGDTLRSSIFPTGEGFGVSLFFSWELFYDKLPSNDTTWQFESIRWTRSGGRSFAGSQSVHNRSSWGGIVFRGLSKENLNAIKRTIIFQAVTKYRDAKLIKNPVGQWADPELGDPEFFQTKVAPLLATLDALADRVNKEMTPDEVETIFDQAVPGWMEIEYQVAALRTNYLEEKAFGSATPKERENKSKS